MTDAVDFEAMWNELSDPARIAVVNLVAEQAARDHGYGEELRAVDHGWMVVEAVGGADMLVTADAFNATIGKADPHTPPGYVEAVLELIEAPASDAGARAFLAACNPVDVDNAIATVYAAVALGTDLTPPVALRHEFQRRRHPDA